MDTSMCVVSICIGQSIRLKRVKQSLHKPKIDRRVFLGWTSTKLGWMCLAQGPQRSDAGEARTRGPSVSSQALYHWATALPKVGLHCHLPPYSLNKQSHSSICSNFTFFFPICFIDSHNHSQHSISDHNRHFCEQHFDGASLEARWWPAFTC